MVRGKTTPQARKVEIKRRLSRICPAPLSDNALEQAARYVETHHDKDAVAVGIVVELLVLIIFLVRAARRVERRREDCFHRRWSGNDHFGGGKRSAAIISAPPKPRC